MVELTAERQARHAERLGPAPAPRRLARTRRRPDLRLRRGEDDRRSCPQGYGLKVGGDANWGINQMIHNLNASERPRRSTSPGRSTGSPRPSRRAPTSSRRQHPVARRRRRAADLPGLRRRARLRPQRRRQATSSPTRSRPIPREPGYEERSNISDAARSGRSRPAARRSSSAPATCTPAASTSTSRSPATAPTPATVDGDDPVRGQAALPLRRPLLRARRRRQLGRQHGGDPAATGGSASKPGDIVSINATYDVKRASWYESMGILPARLDRRPTTRLARDPFDDAAEVQAMYDEGGILTHGRLTREHRHEGPQGPQPARPAQAAQPAGRVPAGGIDIDSFFYLARRLLGDPRLPGAARCARRSSSPGETVTFTNKDALSGDARQTSRSGTASPPAGPPATGLRHRLPARRRPDQVRLRPARLRHRHQLRGDDRLEQLHDAAADQTAARGGRPTRTSAGSTRSCAARSGWPAAGPSANSACLRDALYTPRPSSTPTPRHD